MRPTRIRDKKMKNTFFKFGLFLAFGIIVAICNSCESGNDEPDNGEKQVNTDGNGDENSDWVLINGVRWATRNVGTPRIFVQNPEDYGEYYQWNKGTAECLPADYYGYGGYPNSTFWLPVNDPSPAGYRVPTSAEIQSLLNATKVTNEWTTRNGVNGRKFTDKASRKSIFLPAAGNVDMGVSLHYYHVGEEGNYWSSTQKYFNEENGYTYSYCMCFGTGNYAVWESRACFAAYSVRPVAK